MSFAYVSISTLIAICKDKPLVVLDACDMAVDNIHCKRILDNTQGHTWQCLSNVANLNLTRNSEMSIRKQR